MCILSAMGRMQVAHSEPADIDSDCEIRLGVASWAEGDHTIKSVKYTGFNEVGHVKRWAKSRLRPFPKCSILQSGRDM